MGQFRAQPEMGAGFIDLPGTGCCEMPTKATELICALAVSVSRYHLSQYGAQRNSKLVLRSLQLGLIKRSA